MNKGNPRPPRRSNGPNNNGGGVRRQPQDFWRGVRLAEAPAGFSGGNDNPMWFDVNNTNPPPNTYGPRVRLIDTSPRNRNENPRYSNQRHNSNQRNNDYRQNNAANRNTDYKRRPSQEEFSSGLPKRRPMGFKALENLLQKDPEDLILELSNSKRGMCELMKAELSPDQIVLIVKILKKVTGSSFTENKYKVLQTYLEENFVNKLIKYIVLLPMQNKAERAKNKFFWDDSDDFWNNIVAICQHVLDSLPTFGCRILPDILKGLIIAFPSFESQHSRHISDGIKNNVTKLNETLQLLKEEQEEKEKAAVQKKLKRDDEEGEPPDDFRQISVYPNVLELLTNQTFLRKNVIDKPYKDVNHYLDVQFRLLREDFVKPLREGISTYRQVNQKQKKIESVKIHKKVRFLNPETVNEQFCIRVRFDSSNKKRNFKYENSRRFMFGSLLCFTRDDFKSIIFGKISERKVEDLEKGELIVGFDQNVQVDYKSEYLMVECGVYFEPYYHVLNVLKTMSLDSFPMEKYIIRVEPSVRPPNYLLDPNLKYSVRGVAFYPLVNWPNFNFYNFNPSQMEAFKAALTEEFTIIQGPPGTGKTYLGLKIAKTLLQNQHAWYNKTPMLVICYTNHALDQFLEGLTEFTDKILRVGGQSKNEKLQPFNLRNRQKFKVSPAVLQQRDHVQLILGRIRNVTENLKYVERYDSIRAFDVFEGVVPGFDTTWFRKATKNQILDWLLEHTAYVEAVPEDEMGNLRVDDGEAESEESEDEEDGLDEQQRVEVDDIFLVETMAVGCSIPLITLNSLSRKILELEGVLKGLRQNQNPALDDLIEEEKSAKELFELQRRFQYLNMRLMEGKQTATMRREPPKPSDLMTPHKMPPNARWNFYFYCLNLYKERLLEQLTELNLEFRQAFKMYEEMRDIENTKSMKDVLVVGMTTTGAARLRSSLQALKSPVVIVEEAAEVLEAHIVSSLTNHCQHLILIGDHQQLKPSTASYEIEKFYNLGISLFERMVINKIRLYSLNVQHRMRPEISSLITPAIYPNLADHPSVNDRPAIRGIDNCLFFVDHTHEESNCEGTSKKNQHEVQFLIYLARHLILNGYKPEEITILAAYLGQMFELQKEKKKHRQILERVRIAVLDNYQGEECDVILLSLVRSNKENKIGFLKIENRVCVALSRARNGFYLMGNMAQLCSASEVWPKIRRTLEQQSAIGPSLSLRCQVHPDKVTDVKEGSDFLTISEGGCSQKCGADLSCGHKCTYLCHVTNRDHKEYRCRETCGKRLCDSDPNHLCKKMCFQECGPCDYKVRRRLQCGHQVFLECHVDVDKYSCVVPVATILPCGHLAQKPCHRDSETFRCPHPCEVKVEPCGHACTKSCHVRQDPDHLEYKCFKLCARVRTGCTMDTEPHLCRKKCFEECEDCLVEVQKKRTVCPHVYKVPCSSNVDELECHKPCAKILVCGHKCKSKCCEPCGKCQVKVTKPTPICGHPAQVKCCDEPSRSLCKQKCPLLLPCGHPCTQKCNEPCTPDCTVMVDCQLRASCGHTVTKIQCHLLENGTPDAESLLKFCNQPCRDYLKCQHRCSGTCGACAQGRVHTRCGQKCGNVLVCDHTCEFPCREACRPCVKKCPYKCSHSSCGKRCGDVCTPCKEACLRRCQHQKCRKFCGQICDVPPCPQSCDKELKCGHKCAGFCGDPCPPKCLVCDKDELSEVFFGTEEDEGARFVLLQDCEHVFESSGLEKWVQMDEGEIKFKVCPRCNTPIKTTQRFSDFIKRAMEDVAKVKENLYGSHQEIEEKRQELRRSLDRVRELSYAIHFYMLPRMNSIFATLEKRLEVAKKGKRQAINKPELNAIESKLQIVEHVINMLVKAKVIFTSSDIYVSQLNFILKVLVRDEDYITDQEIFDIQFELNRLSRIIDYHLIQKSSNFKYYSTTNDQVKRLVLQIEELLFFTFERFYDEDEVKVKNLLKELGKAVSSGVGITDQERREIVKAMGFKQGHWYKCPNGHPYAIGECGGAMEEAKCFCGAKIGGGSHALRSDNALASEMDGARYAAWSETANNLANFDLRNLQF